MSKGPATMGDKLRAMAVMVDELSKQLAERQQEGVHYGMLVDSLRTVTTALSDAYVGDSADMATAESFSVGDEIRQAAVILKHAAPAYKQWADDMLKQWEKPKPKKGGK